MREHVSYYPSKVINMWLKCDYRVFTIRNAQQTAQSDVQLLSLPIFLSSSLNLSASERVFSTVDTLQSLFVF